MRSGFFLAPLLAFPVAVGCGGGGGSGGGGGGGGGGGSDGGGGGGGSADAMIDADGFETLISADWSLPVASGPNPDHYICATKTVDHDILISNFRAIAPNGTHHTVLSVGAPDGPDSTFNCDVLSNKQAFLFASGIGTQDFAFPDGIAIRV